MAFRKLFVEFGGRGQTPVKTAEIQDFGTYFPAWQSHKKKVVMLPRSGEDDDKKLIFNFFFRLCPCIPRFFLPWQTSKF